MKKNFIIICVSFILLVSSNFCTAEETKAKSTLEDMVVTVSRNKEAKKEVTVNLSVISLKDIKMSTARDLGELLAEKAGIYIRQYPGALTSIGMRGFSTETHGNDLMGHVLILLDGRRTATGNAAAIMTKNVERVEIIRGPAAVQYGSAAMGGLVNVITKKGKDKPAIFVEGMLGSGGYEEAGIGFSGKVKKFDFSGTLTRKIMDDYNISEGADKNGDKFYNTGFDEKIDYSLNLGFEFLQGHRLGMIMTCFDADHMGNPGYFTLNDKDDYSDKKNETWDIIYDGQTKDALFSWKARYFHTEDDNKWVNPIKSNPLLSPWSWGDDGIPSKRKTDQNGAQGQFSLNLESLSITAGVDWVNYDIKTTWTPSKTEFDNIAGFILAKARLFDDKFIISGGLRYDEYEVKVKKPSGRDEDDDNISPSIGLAYLINDHIKIRVNYAEAFRMPDANNMAADYISFPIHYIGNPDLDSEKSKTYEGGLDLAFFGLNMAATYFHTDFKDKIETVYSIGTLYNATWENVKGATISGFEGELSCNLNILLDLDFTLKPYANFIYLNKYKDEETREDLKYTSDITASYGITLSGLNGTSASFNFQYTGKQDITDYQFGTYDTLEMGGFTVANAVITKQLYETSEYGSITLRAEIKNIFDKDYAYVQGYPMPGRSFFVGLRYDF